MIADKNFVKNTDLVKAFKGFTLTEKGNVAELELSQAYFDKTMVADMKKAFEYLEDESKARFLVLKGRNGVFSKGLNYSNFHDGKSVDISDSGRWEKIIEGVQKLTKTTIAVIDGVCEGAGIQLALACDHRIASTASVFLHTEINYGYLPGCTIMQLGKYCGAGRILELLLTGCAYTADQAKSYGIINDCAEDLDGILQNRIRQYSKIDVRLNQLTRRLAREAFEMPYNNFIGCYQAAQYQAIIHKNEDPSLCAAEDGARAE